VLGSPRGSAVPTPYPPEFRRRALDLVESGRTVRDVAASLGIAESCLHRWRQRDLVDRGLKPGTTAQESAELAVARTRIRKLEEEVKILRKAAAAVEAVVPPKERYRLVAELRAEGVRVGRSCQSGATSRPRADSGLERASIRRLTEFARRASRRARRSLSFRPKILSSADHRTGRRLLR
jgi:transposase-like protein